MTQPRLLLMSWKYMLLLLYRYMSNHIFSKADNGNEDLDL